MGNCPDGEFYWWRIVLKGNCTDENCTGGELS